MRDQSKPKKNKCSFCKCAEDSKTLFMISKKGEAKICHKCVFNFYTIAIQYDAIREEVIVALEKNVEAGRCDARDFPVDHQKRLANIMSLGLKELEFPCLRESATKE